MAQQPPGGWEQFATKGDLAELETRTQEAFLELKSAILELKTAVVETQSSVVALDAKMEVKFSELRGQIATQFGAVDTRFGELSGQRARDVWAFAVAMTVTTISVCCSIFVAVWQLGPS